MQKLLNLPIDRLIRRLESESADDDSIARYHALFEGRTDSGAELLRLAESTTNAQAAGAALLHGIVRMGAEGERIPGRSVDERVRFGRFVTPSWDLTTQWPGLDPFLAAIDALGRDRRARLARTLLAQRTGFAKAWLMLPLLAEDADFVDQAVQALGDWKFPTSAVAMGIALLSPDQLGVLRVDGLPSGSNGRNLAALGRQGSLARAARDGEAWHETWDGALDVDASWPDADHLFAQSSAVAIRAAVSALPEERAQRWLDGQLDPARPSSMRVLLAVPPRSTALVEQVLDFVEGHARLVKKPATAWLGALATALGPDGPALAERLTKKKARKAFEAGLTHTEAPSSPTAGAPADAPRRRGKPKLPARVRKVEDLATQSTAEGPSTWIVALEASGAPTPDALSRVGGPGYALADATPELEGLPMTHVFTLALDDVPDLRPAFPEAVAFSLYVAEPGDLADVEAGGSAVVPLDAATVDRGRAATTPTDLPEKGLLATRVELPARTFAAPSGDARLLRAIARLPARAGGEPFWLQEPQPTDGFLLQLDARFAPVNLGDGGQLYVYRHGAVWQSL